MKRRVTSLLLALVLVMAILPVTAFADAAANIVISDATYHGNGSLKSITTSFKWTSASVSGARLTLMSKKLNGGTSGNWGDFTNFGKYASMFNTFADAQAYDTANNTFGFITYSGENFFTMYEAPLPITLNISEGAIPMNVDAIYYVYLWVTYQGDFYPDNLICAIQVKNGQLQYSVGDASQGRNYYNPMQFQDVLPSEPDPNLPHVCVKSPWVTDATYHWRFCTAANHDNSLGRASVIIDKGVHVYTDNRDPDCNTCGYIRNIPTTGPDTGDITNIPLWTMLFFAGIALMYVQLTQRKREQF